MTFLYSSFARTPPAASASSKPVKADLEPFMNVGVGCQWFGGQAASAIFETWSLAQLGQPSDPGRVSLEALRPMGHHPIVYLAERTIAGIVRRPDLYYVRHKDRGIVRETEEWLWPLLPKLLAATARAFSYGTVPIVLNWGRERLSFDAPDESGTLRPQAYDHTHYVRGYELWPGDVKVELDTLSDLAALVVDGKRYAADRAHLLCWDPEFGSFVGQSARRRAWRDFCFSVATDVLQRRYLERSVDSPRVAYAPTGTVNPDGQEVSTTVHLGELLSYLKGGGTIALPSTRDAHGEKKYEIDTLDLPDRKDVWNQALNRYDGGILKAYLVPPSLAGVDDLAAMGAKVLDGMLREFIQDLAQFAAESLTHLVRIVHRINHDPRKVPAPEILAYEVPAAVRKLHLEVLRIVGAASNGQSAAEWVDMPALLDQLGVPLRTAPLPPTATAEGEKTGAGAAPRGRPRDMAGERQERREDARTDEGEESTGKRTGGDAA